VRLIIRALLVLAFGLAIMAPGQSASAAVVTRGKRCTSGNQLTRCTWLNYRTTDRTQAARGALLDHEPGPDTVQAAVYLERRVRIDTGWIWDPVDGSHGPLQSGTDSVDVSGPRVGCVPGALYRSVISYLRVGDPGEPGYGGFLISDSAVQC
jgi:hypothetical protein